MSKVKVVFRGVGMLVLCVCVYGLLMHAEMRTHLFPNNGRGPESINGNSNRYRFVLN